MKITKGKIHMAQKIVLYGVEGIGRSTLASKFPDPVFIDTEGSTNQLDVSRFDAPQSWEMLIDEVKYVTEHPEVCKTLVIDTADWAEKLCIEAVVAERKWDSIETPGYGKGYTYIREKFGQLLNLLTVVTQKGVNVLLTAHAMMRKFEQPDEIGSYDRWELKLTKQTAPLVKEWCDMLLFANYKTIVVHVKGKNKAQGGKRVIYTTHTPSWDAKKRVGLPDEIPMDYEQIRPYIETAPAETTKEVKPPEPEVKTEPAKVEKPEPATPPEDHTPPNAEVQRSRLTNMPLFVSDKAKLPAALIQLMEKDDVAECYLQGAVAKRGYYPADVKIEDYDPDFIQGVLIAAWPQVSGIAKELESDELPF